MKLLDYGKFSEGQLVTAWKRMKKLRDEHQRRKHGRAAYLFYRAEIMAIEEELAARGLMGRVAGDMDTEELPQVGV